MKKNEQPKLTGVYTEPVIEIFEIEVEQSILNGSGEITVDEMPGHLW